MPYKDYSSDDIRVAVQDSKSIAGVLRKLNLKSAGGNYRTIKLQIAKLDLDTSHFTGQGHMIDKERAISSLKCTANIKRRLIKERGHACESCSHETWFDKPIPLELEHVDGDNLNHEESNLQLLCCNCHAQTKTWRRKKSSL